MNINYGIDWEPHPAVMGIFSTARFLPALLLGGGALLVATAIGCATPGTAPHLPAGEPAVRASAAADRAHIVAIYRSHCGACHRPVAPGSEPIDRLEAELTIHHKRARLSDAEWAGLDAFLARPQ